MIDYTQKTRFPCSKRASMLFLFCKFKLANPNHNKPTTMAT